MDVRMWMHECVRGNVATSASARVGDKLISYIAGVFPATVRPFIG